jgi:SNF2 family DNA or RNA helicase
MKLFSYQEVGVRWLLEREHAPDPKGGFLCDEMGLGKTIQLVETFRRNRLKSTLVIVPKSIVGQWRLEISKFAPELSVHVFDGPKRVWNTNYEIVLMPYSLIEYIPQSHIWDRIVLDEGHEVRNPKSKMCRRLCDLKSNVRWVVSGTPIFNTVKDFVTLCQFIGISKGKVLRDFDEVHKKFVLRRTRDQTSSLDFKNIELDMYSEEFDLYKEAFEYGQEVLSHANVNSMVALECLLRTRQVMIWPQLYVDGLAKKNNTDSDLYTGRSKKHETLFEMLKTHPDEKSLIFTQFTGESDFLQESLSSQNYPVFRLDGQVENVDRERRIEAFHHAPANAIFLIQIKAGGVGLNLQCASRVYIMAPSWNPATELQAIGRSHRTGQNRTVVVRKFVYKDFTESIPSIEQNIVELQLSKSKICADILKDEKLLCQVPGMSQIKVRTIAKMFRKSKT